MSREKGTFKFASNYEVLKQAPIDSREVVDTLDDLTDINTWSKKGNSSTDEVYIYKGLVVKVINSSKLYMYIGNDCKVSSIQNINNWKEITGVEIVSKPGNSSNKVMSQKAVTDLVSEEVTDREKSEKVINNTISSILNKTNIIDVVNNMEELNSYSKDNLHTNDIIIVLNDDGYTRFMKYDKFPIFWIQLLSIENSTIKENKNPIQIESVESVNKFLINTDTVYEGADGLIVFNINSGLFVIKTIIGDNVTYYKSAISYPIANQPPIIGARYIDSSQNLYIGTAENSETSRKYHLTKISEPVYDLGDNNDLVMSQRGITDALELKQDINNIATINGKSITEGGNIEIKPFVKLTQSQYDTLTDKNENVLYCIVDK